MNREELIGKLYASNPFVPRSRIGTIVDDLCIYITEAMEKGDSVQIPGFGTFTAEKRAARTGRNPHTGEAVPIPARTMPVFHPSKFVKQRVSKEL